MTSRAENANDLIWTDDSIRREEVRGIFTFGILAFIFAANQTGQITKQFAGEPQVAFYILDLLSGLLILFWGAYVLFTATSMLAWRSRNRSLRQLLGHFRYAGSVSFLTGGLYVIAFSVLLFILLVIQFASQNPLAFLERIAEVAIPLAIIIFLSQHYKKESNSTPKLELWWKSINKWKFAAVIASILLIGFGFYQITSSDLSQTGVSYSYSADCPPPFVGIYSTCYYIPIQVNHTGVLTLNELTAHLQAGTNLTLFQEDYSTSSWYFTSIEGFPDGGYYHEVSSGEFNGTALNVSMGYQSIGTYYFFILGGFPQGFQQKQQVYFTLTYTVGVSWSLVAFNSVVYIVLPSIIAISQVPELRQKKNSGVQSDEKLA